MGGALSLASAALVPQISASAPFYGIPGEGLCDVGKIKIPVQCHFGELDDMAGFSSPKDVEALKGKLEAGGVNFEVHMYKAGHAFTHKGGANYNKEACELALQRMIDFMKKNL
jgi:carboxymethylenebutenolidase